MAILTITPYETIKTGFLPNMEQDYDDDLPPSLVHYKNESSEDESENEDDFMFEDVNSDNDAMHRTNMANARTASTVTNASMQ